MITENYNIHDIIQFQINKPKKGIFYNLNPEFEYFKVENINKPDIIVNLGKFKPHFSDSYIVDVKYKIKKNYIYMNNKNYEIEIQGLESFSPAIINLNPSPHGIRKFWPILAYQNVFLRRLIEILLVWRGYALLHSAGISDGKNGYLLVGRGGSGKSSLIINALKNEFSLIGEERTLIGNGKAYPYPINYKIIDFWINSMEDEYSHPSFYKYKTFRAFTSSKTPPLEISNPINVKTLYVIKRNTTISETKLNKCKLDNIVGTVTYNNLIDWEYGYMPFITGIRNSFFNRFINSYLYINNDSKLMDYWKSFNDLIEKEAKKWGLFEYIMPELYKKSYAKTIFSHMRNNRE